MALVIARFDLVMVVGDRQKLLAGPIALAPKVGAREIGTVSSVAAAQGVVEGMAIGEALAVCPKLELAMPDPQGVALSWEGMLTSLEALGAAVESTAHGQVCFRAYGLTGLYGGTMKNVVAKVSRAVPGSRIGLAPTRFAALAAAKEARAGRCRVLPSSRHELVRALAAKPVALLRLDQTAGEMVTELQSLGIETLGNFTALGRETIADRFGKVGIRAFEICRGEEEELQPRTPPEPLRERIGINDGATLGQMQTALELLIGRLLGRKERRERSLRAIEISGRLVSGGTWLKRIVLRERTESQLKLKLVLSSQLDQLPERMSELSLAVAEFGAPLDGTQQDLFTAERDERERECKVLDAVRQTRTLCGSEAILRAQIVERESRLPERRTVLVPLE